MANPRFKNMSLLIATSMLLCLMATQANALIPYTRSLWDIMMLPTEDPFRILEQAPLTIPKGDEGFALAKADRKETPTSHVIFLDIPGIKKDDIKIEVEENSVLRISGERKGEEERQFRLPNNADLDHIKAYLEDWVLKITVPKFAEEQKRQPKVINIVEQGSSGQDIKAAKAENVM
ncbi:hypothetical protein P3X46_024638 [Hevea brasiliensis]|uniref:SHSP domain-containing protein n=1 Tax=Hevea brasiliensis TaxID=3981 RepID=A0ABQ9L4L8_HEVBR|nr:hypothetical protein P3X46_024638 [Hevea brasiliensis]